MSFSIMHNCNSSRGKFTSTSRPKIQKPSVRDANHVSYRLRLSVKNLNIFWPPDKYDSMKAYCSPVSGRTWPPNSVRMLKGKNYDPSMHRDVDFMKILNDEFLKNAFITSKMTKKVQKKTGLSKIAIKTWFKMKRSELGFISPIQILSTTFDKYQYLTLEETVDLSKKTGLTQNWIESWFRVSRALANVFDLNKVDKEEMILWRMFELHRNCVSNAEVKLMSYLLDMEEDHVHQIFLTWCQRHDIPHQMTPLVLNPNECASVHEPQKQSFPVHFLPLTDNKLLTGSSLSDDDALFKSDMHETEEFPFQNIQCFKRSHSFPGANRDGCNSQLHKTTGASHSIEDAQFRSLVCGDFDFKKNYSFFLSKSSFTKNYVNEHHETSAINEAIHKPCDSDLRTESDQETSSSSSQWKPSKGVLLETSGSLIIDDGSSPPRSPEEQRSLPEHESVIRELKKLRKAQYKKGVPLRVKWRKPGRGLNQPPMKRKKETANVQAIPSRSRSSRKRDREEDSNVNTEHTSETSSDDKIAQVFHSDSQSMKILQIDVKSEDDFVLGETTCVEEELFEALQSKGGLGT